MVLSSKQQSEIVRRYLQGENGSQLAKEFNCTSPVIYRILHSQGGDLCRERLGNSRGQGVYLPTQEQIAKEKAKLRTKWGTRVQRAKH